MARDNQRSERSRVRYGYCVNPDCENSKKDKKGNRKTYQISMREEFVCPDCRKELHECPPPQPQKPWKLILSLLVGVLAIGCGVYGFLQYKSSDTTDLDYATGDGKLKDEVHEGDIPGAIDLGYATWDGELKNGLPDGQGTLTYLQSKAIEGPDGKARTADAGDYIKGKYADGKLLEGTWYNSENAKKGIIPERHKGPTRGNDETQPENPKPIDLGYALWEGPVKNGMPHGQGVMKFKQQHLIEKRDEMERTAAPGDYITGEYDEGHLVDGHWYGPVGNDKGPILIGR